MKNYWLCITAVAGLILAVSESSTFIPNIIGIAAMIFSAYKAGLLKK